MIGKRIWPDFSCDIFEHGRKYGTCGAQRSEFSENPSAIHLKDTVDVPRSYLSDVSLCFAPSPKDVAYQCHLGVVLYGLGA